MKALTPLFVLLLTAWCAHAQTGERERLESERAAIADRIAATQSLLCLLYTSPSPRDS